jgi:hypothetical protein
VSASRVRERRRVALRVGLIGLAIASVTACIFDRSSYEGGGRSDQGAQVVTPSASATDTTTATATDTTSSGGTPDSGGLPDVLTGD